MSYIIYIAHTKGGVGKTMVSYNVAYCLTKKYPDKNILAIDTDSPQHSLIALRDAREGIFPFEVMAMPQKYIRDDLLKTSQNYFITIVDGSNHDSVRMRGCLTAANMVLVPNTPGYFDIHACTTMLHLVKEAQQFNTKLKCAFVINMKIANTSIGKDFEESLASFDIKILSANNQSAHLGRRVIYPEAATIGKSVIEVDPKSLAAKEIMALTDEIINFSEELSNA